MEWPYEKEGGLAFPLVLDEEKPVMYGMSLRDWFAGQALAGERARMVHSERLATLNEVAATCGVEPADVVALYCYELADAMLKAREESSK